MNRRRIRIGAIVAVLVSAASVTLVFYLEADRTSHTQPQVIQQAPSSVLNGITPQTYLGTLSLPSQGATYRLVSTPITNSLLPVMGSDKVIGVWNDGGSLSGAAGTVLCAAAYTPHSPLLRLSIGDTVATGNFNWRITSISTARSVPHRYLDASGTRRLVIVVVGEQLTMLVASPT